MCVLQLLDEAKREDDTPDIYDMGVELVMPWQRVRGAAGQVLRPRPLACATTHPY